jgi:UDP-N-acetylglucosamine--N-acetylmuramyl-(pentapeptide) pyrophosphoryl-undecaprenol N-acetylglucosamine transferase
MATKPKPKQLWLVGGGTGGHIVPLLAVAEILERDKDIQLTYLGERDGMEYDLARKAGISFKSVTSGKFRRYVTLSSLFLNVRDFFRVIRGIVTSYRHMQHKKPDLIFSKGGPVAVPVVIAAWLAGVPVVTHESDVAIGLANRIIGRFARHIMTAFPAKYYPASMARKIVHVGLPLRGEFCRKQHTPHHKRRPMVLVTGGSQGSVALNKAVAAILPELLPKADVMHITGEYSYKEFQAVKDALPDKLAEHYGVVDFTPDMAHYMHEATVVVMRSGATLFEVASLGKPMILIPLPTAANNHQLKNAEVVIEHKAGILLIQDNLTPDRLYETIATVLDTPSLRRQLQEGTKHFASCDAAKNVANLLKDWMS